MSSNYYFLASLLPELQIGVPPDIDFNELEALLNTNLTEGDLKKIAVVRRYYDIQNVRSFWRNESLSIYGTLDALELEEALLTRSILPSYVFELMEQYDSTTDRLHHFAFLLVSYFREEVTESTGFLQDYLLFQREFRLVLTALRSKKLKRDILVELQYEDPSDDLVAQILAQKDAESYEPPERFSELKPLFEQYSEEPFELHKHLTEFQFQKVDQLVGLDFFSISRILAYIIQLMFVEKWLELDKQKGMELVDTIVKDAS